MISERGRKKGSLKWGGVKKIGVIMKSFVWFFCEFNIIFQKIQCFFVFVINYCFGFVFRIIFS